MAGRGGAGVTRLLAALALLTLSGCGVLPTAVGVAASLSTLMKNEANCSLVALSECTLPHFALPIELPNP